jgi:hypothetical protein
MTAVMAKPSAQKLAAPTTRMTSRRTSETASWMSAWYAATPNATVIPTSSTETSRACRTRAAK